MLTADEIARLRGEICLEGVEAARDRIAEYLPRTPLMRHPLLVEELGCEVYIKHENHLPTGAFKVRGGINFMAQLSNEDRERGVTAATRGNHGQSVAYAAKLFGVRAVIVVPHGNNPEKNAAMRAYGAEVIEHGQDYDEARERVADLIKQEGFRYVHSGNEPGLIHGVGTYSLEILEDLPDVDAVVIPIGGGSGICGAAAVFRALKPDVKIIGVQAENAPCIYESWKRKEWVTTKSANTFADGIATRVPMEVPHAIILDEVDDILLVSEEDIRGAIVRIMRTTHNLAEGAGAAGLAAIARYPERFEGKRVATVLSGGNLDAATLRSVLS